MTIVSPQQPFTVSAVQQFADAEAALHRAARQLPTTPHRYASRLVSAAHTATPADDAVLADATGGAFTVTLPTASAYPGRRYTVVRVNAGANAVTVATVLGGNISLGSQYAYATVQSCLTTVPATFSWVRVG
jgi:NADPH-dependent ferric siderophore reductase